MTQEKKEPTIREWLDTWLEVYIKPCHRERTYFCYFYSIKRIMRWRPEFETRKLTDITEREIQEFINALAADYAKSTLNDVRVVFHQAYEAAVRNQLCETNPVGKITIPQSASVKLVPALSAEEQEMVEKVSRLDPLGHITLFFLYTGLRADELCNLKWKDYDPVKGRITITRSKTANGVRIVPLLPQAKAILDKLPHICETIFTSTKGLPISKMVLKDTYLRVREKTGLEFVTNHVYRHSFATRLVEKGVNTKALAQLLGHKDVAFTMQRYVHPQEDFLREQIYLLAK